MGAPVRSWGGNCLSQAPVEAELAAFQLPSSMPLKRRSVSPGGGGLQGGRFEIAVVEQRQPKITMGRSGGGDPGGQPLPWLAALLVGPVLWPGTADEEPTRPALRAKLAPLPGFLHITCFLLVQRRAFWSIIVAVSFLLLLYTTHLLECRNQR